MIGLMALLSACSHKGGAAKPDVEKPAESQSEILGECTRKVALAGDCDGVGVVVHKDGSVLFERIEEPREQE